MKVILTDYVYKHGVAGDVVTVADGFARNYLIPRKLAIKATPNALRRNQELIEQSQQNRERLRKMENEAAAKIDGVELVFGVKAGKNNKLYGSVTTRDIAEQLEEKTGVDIDRRRISERPLRELGIHMVPVRISSTVAPELKIVIIREEEVVPYLDGQPVESLTETPEVVEVAEAEAEEPVEAAQAEAEVEAEVEADIAVEAEPAPETEAEPEPEPEPEVEADAEDVEDAETE
jgi:large subunit ribosomal protein L9